MGVEVLSVRLCCTAEVRPAFESRAASWLNKSYKYLHQIKSPVVKLAWLSTGTQTIYGIFTNFDP